VDRCHPPIEACQRERDGGFGQRRDGAGYRLQVDEAGKIRGERLQQHAGTKTPQCAGQCRLVARCLGFQRREHARRGPRDGQGIAIQQRRFAVEEPSGVARQGSGTLARVRRDFGLVGCHGKLLS
jgi:hypothetical protein